jgi:hypothetical protein
MSQACPLGEDEMTDACILLWMSSVKGEQCDMTSEKPE